MNSDDDRNLVDRALDGDEAAFEQLFERNRARLKKTIHLRMDRRLAPRVDASDVVQETYLEAVRRWPAYVKKKSMPFYLWLRWIARERIIDLHRMHFRAEKRSVSREIPILPVDSSASFAVDLLAGTPSPSRRLAEKELAGMLHAALGKLQEDERELIVSRDFEGLTAQESALALAISEEAAQKRYTRALDRLRRHMASTLRRPTTRK